MEPLLRDLRHTLRLLIVDRGFAAAALVTIAIGVGGTTAMFSVVYGVLLRPLPYPEPDRLVRVWEEHPGASARTGFRAVLSRPTWHAWSQASDTIEELGSFLVGSGAVQRDGGAQRMRAGSVTPSLFRVLRTSPAQGRLFAEADASVGAAPVVLLSDATWRDQFASNPSAIGAFLRIDGEDRRIVGVLPRDFTLPETGGDPTPVALYTPLRVPEIDPAARAVGIHLAIARLKPGVSIARAEAEGTARARHVDRPMADLVFGKGRPVEVRVRTLVDQITIDVRPVLLMLAGGIALVLLIACANLANLFLSRGRDRMRELAVRAALGAARGRLLRQLLTESLAIALAGGLLGAALGSALTAAVPAFAPASFPRVDQIRLDGWFLLIATLSAAFVGVASGLVPALSGSRVDLISVMNAAGGRTAGDPGRPMRRVLLVCQASLAIVLLVGAALLARSFVALLHVDAGYRSEGVVTADLHLPGEPDRGRRLGEAASAILARLRAAPGVQVAGAGSLTPFGAVLNVSGFALPGVVNADGQPVTARAFHTIITPGYAEALGMRLTAGRFLHDADLGAPTIAMLVNERFGRTWLDDGRPIVGRRFVGMFPRMLGRTDAVVEIVGVVQDVLPANLDAAPEPQIYLPFGVGFQLQDATIVARGADGTDAVATLPPLLRSIVRQQAPTATLDRVGALASRVSASVAQPRFIMSTLGAFAIMALGLAAAGLYASLSYDVARRRREIGVRAALGATRRDLVSMVVREGVMVTLAGLAAGLGAAALAARAMSTLLFGIAPFDLASFSIAPIILFIVAIAACLIPARRAASVDPIETLRAE
jgi:putative ABC transport system permease protein